MVDYAEETAPVEKEDVNKENSSAPGSEEATTDAIGEHDQAKCATEQKKDDTDVDMTTPVKEPESSPAKMDVDTDTPSGAKSDDSEKKEEAKETTKEQLPPPPVTQAPQNTVPATATEKESSSVDKSPQKNNEHSPPQAEKETVDDQEEKDSSEKPSEVGKENDTPAVQRKETPEDGAEGEASKPQTDKEAVEVQKSVETAVEGGQSEEAPDEIQSQSEKDKSEKDATPTKKIDGSESAPAKEKEVDKGAAAAPGNTNMDTSSDPEGTRPAAAPPAGAHDKPATDVTPPILPASSSLPVLAAQPATGEKRPALVAQPAAKRARVNGTLDAVILPPGGIAGGPDLSQATLNRYIDYASKVGTHLISTTADGTPTVSTGNAKEDFLTDHTRYMREIGQPEMRIRTIGGNKLCLYTLYKSVLERGGVQNVILTRTFRLVGKSLNLPKSCTSAAYILRSDYEKLLYAYEQKHVWNRSFDQLPTLHMTDRVRFPPNTSPQHPMAAAVAAPAAAKLASKMRANISIAPSHVANMHHHQQNMQARHAQSMQAATAPVVMERRPKRQAALAASSAVAAAAGLEDESPTHSPSLSPRRTRTMGINEYSLTPRQEQIVEEELAPNAPHAVFNHHLPGERERVIQALWSADHDDVAFALGTLNALSFSSGAAFQARQFPGLLDALYEIIARHLEDVDRKRSFGLPFHSEEIDRVAPRIVPMAAAEIKDAGHFGASALGAEHRIGNPDGDDNNNKSSLQQYGNLFNVVDSIAVDREQCATVAVNIMRNMSFDDRNAMFLAASPRVLDLSAEVLKNAKVPANMRDGLVDMWINVSPYLNVGQGNPGHIVLTTCIAMLDPYLEGADYSRFTNCGEILARLAASPERNEDALTRLFPQLLPRLVDMIGGKDRRYVNAGLAALCNCSAFDWQARAKMATTPRLLPRLVNMLTDTELAPRAALTLLNLAEAPSNRSIVLAYEKQLVQQAIQISPASDTVAGILYDLNAE